MAVLRYVIIQFAVQLFLVSSNPTTLPYNGAFILQRLNTQSSYLNNTQVSDFYLENGCPSSADQVIGQRLAGHLYSTNIYSSVQNPYCVVNVKLADDKIYLDRPYIDVIVLRDPAWVNLYKNRLCITVQFTNSAGASVSGSCLLHERHLNKQTCVIRQIIPFSWFELRSDQPHPIEHLISVSYSVKSQCSAPEYPLFNQRIRLLSTAERFSVFAVNEQTGGQLSLLTRSNLQFTASSLNTIIFHFKPYHINNETSSKLIIIWLWIDPRFEVISATPLESNRWRMKVESASEVNSYITFTLTTIDDIDSFSTSFESYLFAIMLRLRSENERPDSARNDPHVLLLVDWTISDSNESFEFDELANSTSTKNRIKKRIAIVNDSPYTIVAVTKSIDLINTAVLNGLQISESMRIFTLSEAGEAQDVTDQSHCSSAEPRLLKVSSTCTTIFVDGSELRGLANVFIHIQHKKIRAGASFNVWFPRLPITVWAADKTLNALNEWYIPGWKSFDNKKRKRRHDALQSICRNRYQQTEIRILAAFQVVDETTGEQSYLSGSRDQLFDVTQMVMSRVQSTDPQILSIKRRDDRLIVSGKARGTARIVVRAVNANIDFGGTQISVTNEPVSAVQLLLRSITDVQLDLKPKHSIPFQYELTTRIRSEFTEQYQQGSLEINLFYSDGQRELLSDVDTSLYTLSIYSASERSLRIRQQKGTSNIELVMLNNDSPIDSVLTAEMRGPNVCEESALPALASGQIRLNSQLKRLHPNAERIQLNISGDPIEDESSSSSHSIIAILLILLLVFGIFHIVSVHLQGFHNGYEKLVMPLIARLSSNSSLANEQIIEGEKEWVWMPKNQLDNMSVASHFSQRSTLGISNGTNSSNGTSSSESISTNCGTNKSVSISYRGSEISISIGPQASVLVNEEQKLQHLSTATWRSTNGRPNRIQRMNGGRYKYSNEMATSSVHDNLDKYCRNTPLGQYGRATSTLNGIMRRSSDQMSNVYFSNYDKRTRRDLQRLRLSRAPDQHSGLNADDEFFSIRHQSSNPSMSHVPFSKENRSVLPSYASIYCNNDSFQQNAEYLVNEPRFYHHQHRMSNGWMNGDGSLSYLTNPQTSSSRSNGTIRETIA